MAILLRLDSMVFVLRISCRLGWEHSLGLLPHDRRFQNTLKVMGREIGSKSTAANYDKSQEIEAAHFLLRLLDEPTGLMHHIKKLSSLIYSKKASRLLFTYIFTV
jgi:hypothetical protein